MLESVSHSTIESGDQGLHDTACKAQALGTLCLCCVAALPLGLSRWALVLMVATIVAAIVVGMVMAVMDTISQAREEPKPVLKIVEETIRLG